MVANSIFIIEDDLVFTKVFSRKIKEMGVFKTHHYTDCESALNDLLTIKPKAIFLDHFLKGMNGVDALPLFKEILPKVKIAVISGQNDKKILAEAFEKGATNYFRKDVLIMQNSKGFLNKLNEDDSAIEKFFCNLLGK